MATTYNIAVAGATSLVGEAILELLAERKFPVGNVYALAINCPEEAEVQFGNKTLDVENLAEFDFAQVQLVLLAEASDIAAKYVPKALQAGCKVIDTAACFRHDATVPLVVPEVNPEAIPAADSAQNLVAIPNAISVQLLAALQPLHQAVGISRLIVSTYQAVSEAGRIGVDELASQTAQLLNGRPVKSKVYSKQIAFNVIPHIDVFLENGYTKEEVEIVDAIHKVWGVAELPISVTAVQLPVFFGHAVSVWLETSQKLTAQEAGNLLRQAPGIELYQTTMQQSANYPTPVTEALASNEIHVARIREDLGQTQGLSLWLVADNVRRTTALTCVLIAEKWLKTIGF